MSAERAAFDRRPLADDKLKILITLVVASLALADTSSRAGLAVGPDLDLGTDFLLVEDRTVPFDEAFPDSPATDVLVHHRSFEGAQRRSWTGLAEPVTATVLAVDLGTSDAAAALIDQPTGVVLSTPHREAAAAIVDEDVQVDGVARHEHVFQVGRWLFVIEVEAATAGGAREIDDLITSQIRSEARPPPDGTPVELNLGKLFSQPFVLASTWYVIASLVVLLRDRTSWHRFTAVFRAAQPAMTVQWPGVEVHSVGRTATRRRWVLAALGLLGWVARFFAALFALLGIILLPFAPGGAVLVLLIVTGGLLGSRWLLRRLRPDRSHQDRYRTLVRALGRGRWVLVNATVAIAVTTFVVSIVGAGMLSWFASTFADQDLGDQTAAYAEIATFVFIGAIAAVGWPWRRLARTARIGIDSVVRTDARPPVLLLRSWRDDRIKIRTRRGGRHSLIERLSLRRFDRFEETLAWSLWRFGPVVAAGQPGTSPPALGAAREVLPADAWTGRLRPRSGVKAD